MSIFRKPKPQPVPAPFTPDDIRIEASICTGERTIGFYDRSEKKLLYAELVRDTGDIAAFYTRYGLPVPEER